MRVIFIEFVIPEKGENMRTRNGKVLIIWIPFQFKLPNSATIPRNSGARACVFKIFFFYPLQSRTLLWSRDSLQERLVITRVPGASLRDQCERSARDAHKSLPVHVNTHAAHIHTRRTDSQTDRTCSRVHMRKYICAYSTSLAVANRNYLKPSEQVLRNGPRAHSIGVLAQFHPSAEGMK